MNKDAAFETQPTEANLVVGQPSQTPVITYAQELVRRPSITPNDEGCCNWVAHKLTELGFKCRFINKQGVTNLIAEWGVGSTTIALVGHTDVVPAGEESQWKSPPFSAQINNGILTGRGICDMKGGVAAMLAAVEQHLATMKPNQGKILFLLTSDEEGEAEFGTRILVDFLKQRAISIDLCLVGEPTSLSLPGDTIKIGRRGALSGHLTLIGRPGHVGYPKHIVNPIHHMANVIQALNQIQWDKGSQDFPGTSLQITHINSGLFVDNISPQQCDIRFNFRYSHRYNMEQLDDIVRKAVSDICDNYQLNWSRPCLPYFTEPKGRAQKQLNTLERAVYKTTGLFPKLSTSGGTSDGRFLAELGCPVFELGLPNATIHQINEQVSVAHLNQVTDLYQQVLKDFFSEELTS